MSSVVTKIQTLKTTVEEQNERIQTLNQNKKQLWDNVSATYQAMTKYKPTFVSHQTGIETETFPEIRNEDLVKMTPAEVVRRFGEVFRVMASALEENRQEVRSIYAELDTDIDNALDQWQKIKAQDDVNKKSEAFRGNIVANASSARSTTPDLVAPKPSSDFGPTLPPTPPSAPGKKEPIQPISTGKSKSGTTTLEGMLSPTGASKTSKDSKKK